MKYFAVQQLEQWWWHTYSSLQGCGVLYHPILWSFRLWHCSMVLSQVSGHDCGL